MRRVRCKLCGTGWASRHGTIAEFYRAHGAYHNLTEPKRLEGETEEQWLDRFVKWRDQYFEDDLKREAM